MANALNFAGYRASSGVVSLLDAMGHAIEIHIRQLAADKDLLSQLSPVAAFALGNYHADFMEHSHVSPSSATAANGGPQ